MEPSKPKAEDKGKTSQSTSRESELTNSAAELSRDTGGHGHSQIISAAVAAAATAGSATLDQSALTLRLLSGQTCLPQPSSSESNSLARASQLMLELSRSDPAAIARLATSSTVELKTTSQQAQAVLKQEEQALRNTRLMLQQQLEQMTEVETDARASNAPGVKAPGDKKPAAAKRSGSSDEEDAKKPAAEELVDAEDTSQGKTSEIDDDELDDDAYFKGFDKEDSHKVNNETFPFRLYRMLYEVEKSGKQDVASFSNDGQMFCVRKPKRFVDVRKLVYGIVSAPEWFTRST